MIKEGGDEVMKKFGEKFRELRVEPNRNNMVKVLKIGNQSIVRLPYQESQTRRDFQGWDSI